MFEKLLSLLPYSPGISHQMAFYARRMHEEASIRRTGLIFLTLAFMLQFLTVLNPPQPTLADSSNDMIVGGLDQRDKVHGRATARAICFNNTKHFRDIVEYYGIT